MDMAIVEDTIDLYFESQHLKVTFYLVAYITILVLMLGIFLGVSATKM